MILTQLENVSLAFGPQTLLDRVNLQLSRGERVCLVGRNGTGKSTLFKIIAGQMQADDGTVWLRPGVKVAYLAQDTGEQADLSNYDIVASGLGDAGRLLSAYHHAAVDPDLDNAQRLQTLSRLQQQIEAQDGWSLKHRVDTVIDRLGLPGDRQFKHGSGGIRRQVLLARALVSDPDILLLDEPTNHMDISAITWLESFLQGFAGGILFITHDRAFLRQLATRIVELDRGALASFACNYDAYLRRKEEMLNAESKANERFDKLLAEHEVWIRQGIKARRTRNEGRVKVLENMRRERSQRVSRQGSVAMQLDSGDLSGKLVAELRHVECRFADQVVIRDFSSRILRGDRIGIIGPNGCGKSTLLKIILGEMRPGQGSVTTGSNLQIAFFDQQREQLDGEKTVRDNISPGSDYVEVRGQPRHVVSYLRDFLFPADRLNTPVKVLSGGERNRLLLARLFTRPANLLVLDEPTNDLDVDTLELLEELLGEFTGTLLLVSHDRAFLDNIVTSTLVFEGDGHIGEYVGGYADWLRQRPQGLQLLTGRKPGDATTTPAAPVAAASARPRPETAEKRKLGYKEKRELEELPARIEALEQEQQRLEQEISQAAFYQQDKETITRTLARLDALRQELPGLYDRWADLDSR